MGDGRAEGSSAVTEGGKLQSLSTLECIFTPLKVCNLRVRMKGFIVYFSV